MGLYQAKKFWIVKKTSQNKSYFTEYEKIFTDHIFNTGLISKI